MFVPFPDRIADNNDIYSPGYIAGVTNPIFEAAGSWDLLCDIGTNRMVVHKDIYNSHPASWAPSSSQLIIRTGTLKAESSVGSEDEVVRVQTKEGGLAQKPEFAGRPDNADNVFIDDVCTPIAVSIRLPY